MLYLNIHYLAFGAGLVDSVTPRAATTRSHGVTAVYTFCPHSIFLAHPACAVINPFYHSKSDIELADDTGFEPVFSA